MDRLVNLTMAADFVGKSALMRIKERGVSQLLIVWSSTARRSSDRTTSIGRSPVTDSGVGRVTSAIHSPRLEKNIALAMVASPYAEIGTRAVVDMLGEQRNCEVVPKPFYDPKKSLASQA